SANSLRATRRVRFCTMAVVASTPTSAVSRRVSSSSSRSSSIAFLPRNRLAMPSPRLALVLARPSLSRANQPPWLSPGLACSCWTGAASGCGGSAGGSGATSTGSAPALIRKRLKLGRGASAVAGKACVISRGGSALTASASGCPAAGWLTASTCTTGASRGGAGATSGRPGEASTVTFAATSGAVAACATVLSGGVGVSLATCTSAGSSWGFLRSQPNSDSFSGFSAAAGGVFFSSGEPNMLNRLLCGRQGARPPPALHIYPSIQQHAAGGNVARDFTTNRLPAQCSPSGGRALPARHQATQQAVDQQRAVGQRIKQGTVTRPVGEQANQLRVQRPRRQGRSDLRMQQRAARRAGKQLLDQRDELIDEGVVA